MGSRALVVNKMDGSTPLGAEAPTGPKLIYELFS